MTEDYSAYKKAFFDATHYDPQMPITAFQFGDSEKFADELGALVLAGVKTGTSSGYDLYIEADEKRPYRGQLQMVLDGRKRPLCIIQNVKVTTLAFKNITAEHAWLEGEGDRTLAYWRRAHLDFFPKYYRKLGLKFNEDTLIIFENFKVIHIFAG